MRICVLGAGAIGGYFGARLAEAGRDVTFLVRPARAAKLAASGLRLKSKLGDAHIAAPVTVTAEAVADPFDLVILSCKAFDLDSAMDAMGGAVGPQTAILPLLNGMAHLDRLDERFGAARVLGGQCVIAATLGPEGEVIHLNESHALTFGERDGAVSARVEAITAALEGANLQPRASAEILQDMWEKWVFLASLAAGTSLMRASVGDIVAAPGGANFMLGLVEECRSIAAASGFPPRDALLGMARGAVATAGSPLDASMARDIANGAPIEADHVIGDLIARSQAAGKIDLARLETAYIHLKAYEAKRAREVGG